MAGFLSKIKAAWSAFSSTEQVDVGNVAHALALPDTAQSATNWVTEELQRAAENNEEISTGVMVEILRGRVPPRRGTHQILLLHRTSLHLRSCLAIRAGYVSSTQIQIFRKKSTAPGLNGRITHARMMGHYGEYMRSIIKAGEIEPVEDGRLARLIDNPSEYFGRREVYKLITRWIDLAGEAFLMKRRNAIGDVVELIPIPPTWVMSIPDGQDNVYRVQYKALNISVPKSEMIYFRDVDVATPYERGSGLSAAVGDELSADEAAAASALARFANGNVPDTLISFAGVKGDSAIQNIEAKWNQRAQGVQRRGKALFVEGDVKIQRIANTLVEDDHKSIREMYADFIRQAYAIPPELMGNVSNSNRSTIEASRAVFAQTVIIPMMDLITDALNAQLAPDFGGDLFIGYENPVPEDREFTLKVLQAGVGVASVDEWRDLAGLGRIHGGSVFIANSSGYSAYQNPSMIQPIQTTSPVTPSATAKTPTPTVPTAAPAQQKSKSATKPNPSTKAPPQSRGAQLQVENRVIGGAVLMAMLEAAIQTDLMFELCSPIFLEILVEFGVLRAKELGKDISIDDAAMQLIMQQERARFDEYITATTRNQIAEILEPVLSKSIDEQRTAIIDYFSSSTVSDRAKMIADTETVVTSEKAALRAYNAAGIVKRRWLSTPDGRTRDSHRAMNGQETNLLGDFVINRGKNSGRTGKGPGLFGIASEDIYCRCVSTIVVDRERDADLKYSIFRDEINNPQITRAVWERVEAKRVQFQDQLLVAIQAGFDAQRDALLEQL